MNTSLAALKCEKFEPARAAAQKAVDVGNANPKAYWRRAEALAGLGEPAAACRDFEHLLTMKIDKATRAQVEEKLRVLQAKVADSKSTFKATMEKAMSGGVFGSDRDDPTGSTGEFVGAASASTRPDRSRARPDRSGAPPALSKEGCRSLLADLERAYDVPEVQASIGKAAKAADYEMGAKFLRLLSAALEPVQQPILEKYGFPTGKAGAQKMQAAIQYHTHEDADMKKQAHHVRRLAYGGEVLEGMDED